VVYFAGASCRVGRDAARTSTAGCGHRERKAALFGTISKRSLSGAEFPPARNVALATDLKPVPVVSRNTGQPRQVLPGDPILSPATITRHSNAAAEIAVGMFARLKYSFATEPLQRSACGNEFSPRLHWQPRALLNSALHLCRAVATALFVACVRRPEQRIL
jgi:hypothetical protein